MQARHSIHGIRVFARTPSPSSMSSFSAVAHRPHRDSYDYTRLLQSRSGLRPLQKIHAQIIAAGHDCNPFLAAKLVSRYAELDTRAIKDARQVFDRAPERDLFLWNIMIRSYAGAGAPSEAIYVYYQLRRTAQVTPNCYTYSFALKACAAMGDDRIGMAIHAHTVRDGSDLNLFVGNALVTFYAKCGELDAASKMFNGISAKDIVSWNSMFAAYTQNNCAADAITLLHEMLGGDAACKPDRITFVTLLPACAALAASQEGMWIHSYIVKNGMVVDDVLASGLVGMYGSCGRLRTARKVFDGVAAGNVVVCNSMIQAYGTFGRAMEALEIFSRMLQMGVKPDGICFVCLLSACSHAVMVDKGLEVFEMMESYGVNKEQIHYACMVDLLGRSGKVGEAVKFIEQMPVEPGRDVWGALLGACRIHGELELAEMAAKRLFILDPENAGRYLALANMYEDVGWLEDAARVRKAMKDRGVRKPMGCSMVEVEAEVHTFGIEDVSHPMTHEIYGMLGQLQQVLEEEPVAVG